MGGQFGDEAQCAFNESFNLTLKGELDITALEAAMRDIVARHDTMRATISADGKSMCVANEMTIPMPKFDFRNEDNPQAALKKVLFENSIKTFDMEKGPLIRTMLVHMKDDKHVFMFGGHHIILDIWSVNILLEELGLCYAARKQGRMADLPPVMTYRRYALKQSIAKQEGTTAEKYWLKQFETLPEPLELPADRSRPAIRSYAGATHVEHIDEDLYRDIKATGAKMGSSLYATLFANMQVMLGALYRPKRRRHDGLDGRSKSGKRRACRSCRQLFASTRDL